MMIQIQLNDEDDGAVAATAAADDDDDYLGSKVCQRCLMQRDQWGSLSAEAKPEGPKKTATLNHRFTLCVRVKRKRSVCKSLTVSHTHTLHI